MIEKILPSLYTFLVFLDKYIFENMFHITILYIFGFTI